MRDLVAQASTLVLLAAGMWWGYRRWIRPHIPTLNWESVGMLLLLVLTFLGGTIGSPIWWLDDPRSFSWDLPPLASRMLGAAGWSFAVTTWFALEQPTARRVRLILILLAMYLVPLVLAIVLFHLDRFDWNAPITYAFFIISGGMSLAALYFLARKTTALPDTSEPARVVRPATQLWLGLVAALTAAWSLALFGTDQGPSRLVWAWPGDLLTSRLISVMLLTISVGAALGTRFADRAHMMLAMMATYGIGITMASLWNTLAGKPIPLAYCFVFGAIFVGSALLLLLNRTATRQLAGTLGYEAGD